MNNANTIRKTEIFQAPPYEGTFRFPCLPVCCGIQQFFRKSETLPGTLFSGGEFSFLYLLEGSCLFQCQEQEFQIEQGECLLACDEIQSCTCLSDNCAVMFLCQQGDTAYSLGQQLQKQFSPVFHLAPKSQALELLEAHLELCRKNRLKNLYEESEFCYHFLLTLSQEQSPVSEEVESENGIPKNLAQSVAYLESHLNVPFLNLDKLAQIANLSKFHFIRLFTKYYGTSPGKYLLEKRLYRASQLLAENQAIPLKEIITKCGFSSETYFCSAFRRAFHCSPGSHRRMMQSTDTKTLL